MNKHPLSGVYAAALTPLNTDGVLLPDDLLRLLRFLANRGCHGALLHGTTGEGPSFAPHERIDLWRAAISIRQEFPDFRLLAGTGTPSLEESRQLTRAAFELGFDGVVVLPPYYFRNASEEGLLTWFKNLIGSAVPVDGAFFGYHIPGISGVGLSLDLLAKLKEAYPKRFTGIKDSSSDPKHAKALGEIFRQDLLVLSGNDRLLRFALENHAGGCITAMANLISPFLRRVWEAYPNNEVDNQAERQLEAAREIFEAYPPAPSLLKYLLSQCFEFPRWAVRAPLLPLSPQLEDDALTQTRRKLDLSNF